MIPVSLSLMHSKDFGESESFLPSTPPPLKFPLGLVSPNVRPYLELIRIEKPTGIILMYWPFVWGLTMAAFRVGLPVEAYASLLLKYFFAAFILRCSACTVNDIFDRHLDAGVERCRTRPLPSGRISVFSATTYLLIQYAIGFLFYMTVFDDLALRVALFQLFPLFMVYPLFKRFTYWPQAWLGLAMNFGFITSWIAITGTPDYAVLSAGMVGCWSWTMLYDTIYACQDLKDDIRVGVRSTAILFGTWIRPLLIICGLNFVVMLFLVGYFNNQCVGFFVVSVGGTLAHIIWQGNSVDLDNPKSCWQNFKRNGQLGWVLWAGLALDYFCNMDML